MLLGMFGLAGSGLASGMAASRALLTTLGSCCSAWPPAIQSRTWPWAGCCSSLRQSPGTFQPGAPPGSIQWLRCGRI